MVLQAVSFLHNTSPPEFSSIPFITAPTSLDSKVFCPLRNCTALQSHLSTSCLHAYGGKEQYFHPMKNQSYLLIQKLPSVPHLLLHCFSGFLDCLTVSCWGRLLGEVCRVCCGCSSSACMGHPYSPTPSIPVCFCSSSGSLPSSSHFNSSDVILV